MPIFRRFIVPAALLAALGLGFSGGAAYSWDKINAYKNEILHLQEFCADFELAANFVTVTRVIDGDTLKLENGESVRLIGPDTPEICHFKSNGELQDPECVDEVGGQAATTFTRELVEGEEVVLVGDIATGSRDYFGRLLRYVYFKDRFLNLELIEKGYAPVYDRIEKDSKFLAEFETAEGEARAEKIGLWAE